MHCGQMMWMKAALGADDWKEILGILDLLGSLF